jgi:hypothetical protein
MRPGRIAVLCLFTLFVPSPAPAQSANGELTLAAGTYPHNPEIEVQGNRRCGAADEAVDRGVSLSQQLAVARAAFEHTRRQVLGRVEIAFATTVRDRGLRTVAAADLRLARVELALAVGSADNRDLGEEVRHAQ